jgi:hypothetical protein
VSRPALSVGEDAALFQDGWMAVARLDPYRVDWRTPAGTIIPGEQLPVPVIPFDTREREAYLARTRSEFSDPEGHMPAAMKAAVQRLLTDLPETIPPFLPRALIAGADCLLYIRRTPTVDHPSPTYDAVDRSGRLRFQIELAPRQRLVAAGVKHLYIVTRDSSDLERLSRHPTPLVAR